jgi:circadian clock protein KaiB
MAVFYMKTEDRKLLLDLYISTYSTSSQRALTNLKVILDAHVTDGYSLIITDIKKEPAVTLTEDIIAIPLLIKRSPSPCRRLVGDMSDKKSVLESLGIPY